MIDQQSPIQWWDALHDANMARIDAHYALAKRCIALEYRVSLLEVWIKALAVALVAVALVAVFR